MKVKALVSFAGVVTMAVGDVKDIQNKTIVADLIKAKYVEEVKSAKKVKTNED